MSDAYIKARIKLLVKLNDGSLDGPKRIHRALKSLVDSGTISAYLHHTNIHTYRTVDLLIKFNNKPFETVI